MESIIEQSCPMCYTNGTVRMIVNVHEIPYFGEHTELSLSCNDCGWKKTDFLSGDDNTPSKWELGINRETITARVVRSSSCTVRVEELDLEVEPGIAADGYVSNVEGVLNRFISAIEMLQRQASQDDDESCYADCQVYIDALNAAISGEDSELTLVLLDPLGNSKILHEEARDTCLSEREVEGLSVGPTMPIFDASDLGL